MGRKETRPIYGGRSLAALLTLTGTLLWSVPVVKADPPNYRFVRVAKKGGLIPGGGGATYYNFWPSDVNKLGDALFVNYTYDEYAGTPGIYVRSPVRVRNIYLDADGFPSDPLGHVAINDNGDVAFGETELTHSSPPYGIGGSLYRYSSAKKKLTAIVSPGAKAPGGGTFQGVYNHTSLNNRGDIVFPGIVDGYNINPNSPPGCRQSEPNCYYPGLGIGVFRVDPNNNLHKVVKPGDPAPGGRVFDWAADPWINDRGDVAFGAHLAGDWCNFPQDQEIYCPESVYLKPAGGAISSIARQGHHAPGAGEYRQAFGPIVNKVGQVVYIGDLTPAPDWRQSAGVFLYSDGVARAVALPGDNMPGGGKLVSAATYGRGRHDINNPGQVSFSALLNQDVDSDGNPDSAAYLFTPDSAVAAPEDEARVQGTVKLVVRTGSFIEGVGKIKAVSGGMMNDSGRMLVEVTTKDGLNVLLLGIPTT